MEHRPEKQRLDMAFQPARFELTGDVFDIGLELPAMVESIADLEAGATHGERLGVFLLRWCKSQSSQVKPNAPGLCWIPWLGGSSAGGQGKRAQGGGGRGNFGGGASLAPAMTADYRVVLDVAGQRMTQTLRVVVVPPGVNSVR